MSPQSIVCTTCDAAVPYGRLSCPACGELLASVAGAARSTMTAKARGARGRAAQRAVPAVAGDVPPQLPADEPSEPTGWAPGASDPAPEATSTSALGWDVAAWDMHEPEDDQFDHEAIEAPVEHSPAPAPRRATPDREPSILQPVSDAAGDGLHVMMLTSFFL